MPVCDGGGDCLAALREVWCDQRLLAVLAAADVEQVVGGRVERVAGLDARDVERVAPQRGPPGEDGDVAAVGVDVEVVGVEVRDRDPHRAPSQYGRTRPRSTAIARRSSMAV